MNDIEIEGFFDCSCVWAYLAFAHATRFAASAPVAIRWRPVLGQELFDTVNPAARWPLSPVKQAYYRRDLEQWAAYLDCSLSPAGRPPEDATDCMLACVAAGRWDRLEEFAQAALNAAWADGRDIADRAVLKDLWESAGLPSAAFEPGLSWPGVAEELAANTRELMARGGFGTPTFFLGDDMFFGNGAIPLLERAVDLRLKQAGVQP